MINLNLYPFKPSESKYQLLFKVLVPFQTSLVTDEMRHVWKGETWKHFLFFIFFAHLRRNGFWWDILWLTICEPFCSFPFYSTISHPFLFDDIRFICASYLCIFRLFKAKVFTLNAWMYFFLRSYRLKPTYIPLTYMYILLRIITSSEIQAYNA